MSDLIDRQAAIDAINSYFGFNIEEEYGSAVQEVINGLPSAQPERKKGKWIESGANYECPFCHEEYDYIANWNGERWRLCPMCGARLEDEHDE